MDIFINGGMPSADFSGSYEVLETGSAYRLSRINGGGSDNGGFIRSTKKVSLDGLQIVVDLDSISGSVGWIQFSLAKEWQSQYWNANDLNGFGWSFSGIALEKMSNVTSSLNLWTQTYHSSAAGAGTTYPAATDSVFYARSGGESKITVTIRKNTADGKYYLYGNAAQNKILCLDDVLERSVDECFPDGDAWLGMMFDSVDNLSFDFNVNENTAPGNGMNINIDADIDDIGNWGDIGTDIDDSEYVKVIEDDEEDDVDEDETETETENTASDSPKQESGGNNNNNSIPDYDYTDVIESFELTEEVLRKAIDESEYDILVFRTDSPGVLTESMLEMLKESGKTLRYVILDDLGEELIIWELKEILRTDAAIDMKVSFSAQYEENILEIMGADRKTIILEFAYSGALPGSVNIFIRNVKRVFAFDRPSFKDGEIVYLYLYDDAKKALDPTGYPVVFTEAREYVGFTIDHCSMYTVTTYRPLNNQTGAPGETQTVIYWWVIVLASIGGLVVIGGGTLTVLMFLKKRKGA